MTSPINSINSSQLIEWLSKFFGGSNFLQTNTENQQDDILGQDYEYGVVDNLSENTGTRATGGTDWTALKIEGKGINVYNLYNFLREINKTAYNKHQDKIDEIKNTGTDEQKALLEEIEETGLLDNINIKSLMDIARFDTDSDGFLSDDELKIIHEALQAKEEYAKADHFYGYDRNNKELKEKVEKAEEKMKQYSAYSLDMETYGELVYGSKDKRWGVDDGGFREFTSTVVNGKRVYLAEGGWGNMYLTDDQFEILDKYFSGDKYKNYVGDDKDGEDVLKIEEELGAEYDTNLEYNMTNSAGLTSHYYNGGIFCGVCDEGLYKIYRAIKKEREKFNIH